MKRQYSVIPALYAVFLMVPIFSLVMMSIKTNKEVFSSSSLLPRDPTLANFKFILSDPAWYMGYINATSYVLINVVISICVAVPAAYGFSRFRFLGDRYLFFGFLTFRMMAPAILLVPFVQIFSSLELIDTYIAVSLAHCFFTVPISIWILEGFISSVPREMDEIAMADGYSKTAYFIKILLPQIAPGIAVTAFFCFMFSWVELLLANGLTIVHAKPIGAIMTRAASILSANVSLLAAASVLTLVPGVILIALVRKHLARGFSMGQVS